MILLGIVLLVLSYRVSRGAGTGGPLALFMVPRTTTIAESTDFDYVLSQNDFAGFVDGQVAKAFIQSEEAAAATLDVTTTDPGRMVLAVLNASSVVTDARVRATAVKAVCQ